MVTISDFIEETVTAANVDGVVVGVSGGVDSAVVLALCVQALGIDRVSGINMPSAMNDPRDTDDAEELCRQLGVEFEKIPIAKFTATFQAETWLFNDPVAFGNLCARIRMVLLYGYAGKHNALVAGTGNKTEFLLGYTTKYGDSAADFYPILHLWKTQVWELARELGVPDAIIRKAPSAGLWPGQTDEGEIGMSYMEMDTYLRVLEKRGFTQPDNQKERDLLTRYQRNAHKRIPGVCMV